jgi:hypothetical protein
MFRESWQCSRGTAGEAVVEAAGKVGAVVEKAGGVYRIRYVDRFMDK